MTDPLTQSLPPRIWLQVNPDGDPEDRSELLDSVGKPVLVIVGDAQAFSGGAMPQPDPQQPELPIADAA